MNETRNRTGIALESPNGHVLKYVVQITLKLSNNEVEYEALLTSIDLAKYPQGTEAPYQV